MSFLKLVTLISVLVCLSMPNFAEASNIIGLLKTNEPLYENENKFSVTSKEFIEAFGGKVVLVDYRELVGAKGDLYLNVSDFLSSQGIEKVLIPGDFYNIDSLPHHPNDHRLRVTEVLIKLSREKKITLVGICGGLQSVMSLQGVKIKHLSPDLLSTHLKDFDLYSDSLYQHPEAVMNTIKLDPTGKITAIMRPHYSLYDSNGWINLSIPDTHSEAILRDEDNLRHLSELGYRVVGLSKSDGVVEIVEDNFGNFFFQGHPDALVLLNNTHSKYKALPERIQLSIEALQRFWRFFILS